MTIEEHILANPILRDLRDSLNEPFLEEVLEIQTAKGLAKYPNTVSPDDYTAIEWIEHNIQELMDSTIYGKVFLEKIHNLPHAVTFRKVMEEMITNNIEKMKTLVLLRKLLMFPSDVIKE